MLTDAVSQRSRVNGACGLGSWTRMHTLDRVRVSVGYFQIPVVSAPVLGADALLIRAVPPNVDC